MRRALFALELVLLLALTLGTRCANYRDVFVGDTVFFTDADCYARMSRVRLVWNHEAAIVRHHDFENAPTGISPHTTAPLDFLIIGLALLVKPLTAQPLDVAGAWISPLLGCATAAVLWFWLRGNRFRCATLLLFAISPILVHGTILGRPDHQSLLMLLVTVATCADLRGKFPIAAGIAWGCALWVSLYEPLIVFAIVTLTSRDLLRDRTRWLTLLGTLGVAAATERRLPSMAFDSSFSRWAQSLGELAHVEVFNTIWLNWFGLLIVAAPFLIGALIRQRRPHFPTTLVALAAATFLLTIWQARWAYFFGIAFVMLLPTLLSVLRRSWLAWFIFAISLFPIFVAWDGALWPNESETARRALRQRDNIELHEVALQLRQQPPGIFVAPWWMSPALAYWSGHQGAGGSSHEAIRGNISVAEFYLTSDAGHAHEILQHHRARYVIGGHADETAVTATQLIGAAATPASLAYLLERAPSSAPAFLVPLHQNGAFRLFAVHDSS